MASITPKVPVNTEFPPTNNFLAIEVPPEIVKHPPAVLEVASVVSANDIAPLTLKVLNKDVAPVTPKVLDKRVAPVTPKVLEREAAPVTPKVLERVVAAITPKVPVNTESPPTNNFLAIAVPPAIVKQPPAVLEVASVASDNVTTPVTPKVLDKVVAPVTAKVLDKVVAAVTPKVPVNEEFPPIAKSVPTNNFLAIAVPPEIVKHPPTVLDEASIVSINVTTPVTPKVLERVVAPVTPKVLDKAVAPVILIVLLKVVSLPDGVILKSPPLDTNKST